MQWTQLKKSKTTNKGSHEWTRSRPPRGTCVRGEAWRLKPTTSNFKVACCILSLISDYRTSARFSNLGGFQVSGFQTSNHSDFFSPERWFGYIIFTIKLELSQSTRTGDRPIGATGIARGQVLCNSCTYAPKQCQRLSTFTIHHWACLATNSRVRRSLMLASCTTYKQATKTLPVQGKLYDTILS